MQIRKGKGESMIDQWEKGAKYWDKAWNPVIGCEKVSEGCANCYAESLCKRFDMNGDGQFTPKVKSNSMPPKTGVVFVGNMTDIFGDWNDFDTIAAWLNMLSRNAENIILTKRAERMFDYMRERIQLSSNGYFWGITAENQKRLEERAPQLMQTGCAHKWISLEPLLGTVNIAPWLLTEHQKRGFDNQYISPSHNWQYRDKFDWVVVGAESGPARRECKIEWVEQIVEDCSEWNVPVFVKQLDIDGKLVTDINKFPEHLQIRQVPWMERAGR